MLYIKVPNVLPSVNDMIYFQVEKPVLICANNLSTASMITNNSGEIQNISHPISLF